MFQWLSSCWDNLSFRAHDVDRGIPGKRSSKWPALERAHKLKEPACQWCGSTMNIQVHHIRPFHLQPDLQLDPANLISLCETPGVDCHLRQGHRDKVFPEGSFRFGFNLQIREECEAHSLAGKQIQYLNSDILPLKAQPQVRADNNTTPPDSLDPESVPQVFKPVAPRVLRVALVGIDKYPDCPLPDCTKDVAHIEAFLQECYGGIFKLDIRKLLDTDATAANIRDLCRWLAADPASIAPVRLFHYSGHGIELEIADPDSPDGLETCIAAVDFAWSDPETAVTARDFETIFSKMNRAVHFNWISDSCHSQSLDRNMEPLKHKHPRRCWPNMPLLMAQRHGALKYHGHIVRAMHQGLQVGFVGACGCKETAASTGDGGALTTALITTLHTLRADPLAAVVAVTRQTILSQGFDQHPVADGPLASIPFLGDPK